MEPIPGEVARQVHAPPGKRVKKVQVIAVILIATLCVAVGETLLAAGMKEIHREQHNGIAFVLDAISNRYVLLGTFLMLVYFSLYSLTLSWADISFVLPFTALSYLFVALFARFFLHEPVTLTRWIGAFIIVLGVIIVGLGERHG